MGVTAPRGCGNIPPTPAPAPLDPPALISPLSGAAPVGAGLIYQRQPRSWFELGSSGAAADKGGVQGWGGVGGFLLCRL